MPCGNSFSSTAVLILICLLFPSAETVAIAAASPSILHHRLHLELVPGTHELIASDEVELQLEKTTGEVAFTLAQSLKIQSVESLPPQEGRSPVEQDPVPFRVELLPESSGQRVVVTLPGSRSDVMRLLLKYRGVVNDPPREPRHLRFVTPSETSGHIGPEGVYLSSESQWYPDLEGSLARFTVATAVPLEWTVVTQGRKLKEQSDELRRTSSWIVSEPTEALTLVANKFVSKSRQWHGSNGGNVELATYFLSENAALADEYLDATARYLDVYAKLLGDYPFEKFAVVENFFASGLGMPSFTLLGSGIIRRHYTQPYALGHEIVHSWIGNAVFNQIDRGNWVEGLTTYLANYYWHEQAGDAHQAREQRRMMLAGYNLHAPPDRDYPLGQFSRKRDERDNAIGYQKAAMVFHLLRREIGEDAFWTGLKRLVTRFRGRYAEWSDLEQVFTQAAGRDLRWFFAQWIEAPGAPELAVQSASARVIGTGDHRSFQLKATIDQTGRIFRLTIPVTIKLSEGGQHTFLATLDNKHNEVDVTVPDEPASIELDPDSQVIRRVPRESLPPVLNHFVTDRQRTVLTAFSDPTDGTHPFRGVVTRIEGQDAQKPETERAAIGPISEGALLSREGSVLVLASPDFRGAVESVARTHCGDRVELREGGVILDARAYEGPEVALLANCHRKDRPGSVVTLLYAETPQAAKAVSRLLFFYGWSSYLVFKNGNPIARGEWETAHDRTEVRIHGRQRSR